MEIIELEFKQIAKDLLGAEGPVFVPDGEFYMVCPEEQEDGKDAGTIVTVNLDTGDVATVCKPQFSGCGGIPAGCQSLRDGSLYVADMRLGILHVLRDGSFTQLAVKDSEGRPMQGCNDCVLDFRNRLWVTAPAGPLAPETYTRSMQEAFGSVYCYLPESGSTVRVDTGLQFPNGIAVQNDASGCPATLLVAETPHKRIWAYDIASDAHIANKRLWATLPGEHEGGPDGMDFDSAGNLLVANWGSSYIDVFSPPGGEPWARIKCPFSRPSNLHFRPGSRELLVTEHECHAVWSCTWRHQGMPQYCDTK